MSPPEKVGTPLIPVSWGELIDKITILELKIVRLESDAARANAARELSVLQAIAEPMLAGDPTIADFAATLKSLNVTIWDVEDRIRAKEAHAQFDDDFVQLARTVYKTNDQRAALKRTINLRLASEFVEEKHHRRY